MFKKKSNIRIDFLGSPAVGKSKIYNEVIKKNNLIMTEEKALLQSLKKYKQDNVVKDILYYIILRTPILNYKLSKKLNYNKRYLRDFINENETFLNQLFEILYSSKDPSSRKVFGYDLLIKNLKTLAFIQKNLNAKNLFIDESLSQKVYGVVPNNNLEIKNVESYFLNMPKPDILIYVYNDEEVIYKNIFKRKRKNGKFINSHRDGYNSNDLKNIIQVQMNIAELGKNILEKRGVSILKLRSDNLEKNIKTTNRFLTNYFSRN